MSKAPDMITAYAKQLNEAQRYTQKGLAIPPQLKANLQHIEQIASVQLNPEQIQATMEHVNRIRLEDSEWHQQTSNALGAKFDQVRQDRAFKSASSGMSPEGKSISPEQISEAHNNSGRYTIQNKPKIDLEALDKHTRNKFGCSLEEFEERQSNLFDVNLKGDDKRTAQLRTQYGISEAEQKAYVKQGFQYHWDKKQQENNGDEPESYEVEMSESGLRKADIMIAMSGEHGESVYDEPILDSYLEGDDRQNDVARAFSQEENKSVYEEVQNSMGIGE